MGLDGRKCSVWIDLAVFHKSSIIQHIIMINNNNNSNNNNNNNNHHHHHHHGHRSSFFPHRRQGTKHEQEDGEAWTVTDPLDFTRCAPVSGIKLRLRVSKKGGIQKKTETLPVYPPPFPFGLDSFRKPTT